MTTHAEQTAWAGAAVAPPLARGAYAGVQAAPAAGATGLSDGARAGLLSACACMNQLPAGSITPEPAFAGFWMGGYEGADHINGPGLALDMAQSSGHLDRLEEDHRRAAQAGIACVRESIGWRLCEAPGGAIDLTRALRIEASARRHGLQVLWTLMHYGLPADLHLHDDALIPRLARFAAEVARVIGRGDPRPPVFTPVNEIGFLAWGASQPGLFHAPNNLPADGPGFGESSRISGYIVKRRLARASLAAMAAMRQVQPRARFLHVEPLVHVVPPHGRPDLAPVAERVRGWQWQAWDLLAGRNEPELGGALHWLDLVGVNHYHSSQWEIDTEARLDWYGRDPRRRPFSHLLAETWQRYGRPLIIAETSHVGAGRANWLHEVAGEVRQARRCGVPVQGICLYPLVDRPDWQQPERWHRSGLWHVDSGTPAAGRRPLARHAEPDALAALRAWQRVLPDAGAVPALPPWPAALAHRPIAPIAPAAPAAPVLAHASAVPVASAASAASASAASAAPASMPAAPATPATPAPAASAVVPATAAHAAPVVRPVEGVLLPPRDMPSADQPLPVRASSLFGSYLATPVDLPAASEVGARAATSMNGAADADADADAQADSHADADADADAHAQAGPVPIPIAHAAAGTQAPVDPRPPSAPAAPHVVVAIAATAGGVAAVAPLSGALARAPAVVHVTQAANAPAQPVLLAFSHLRWDFMRHRSRQLLPRLIDAAGGLHGWRLVYVEEPLLRPGTPRLDCIAAGPDIDVLVPHTPLAEPGFNPLQQPLLQALLAGWLQGQGIEQPGVAWLATPMAWPLAQALCPAHVVYDCADEMAGFLGTPAALAGLEAELLASADLVLAASPALAAARTAAAGQRLRLLANGVDAAFFGRPPPVPGSWAADEVALLQLPHRGPGTHAVLGYAGGVDERFDMALLLALADARPQWQFVIAGPVLKIDAQALPQRPNLRWLGVVHYRLLPALMAGWQVALLPFVHGLATRHALPLKVLEALAAGLPVVATGLPELRPWHAAGVRCADGAAAFVQACEQVLAETPAARRQRQRAARKQLAGRDWLRLAATAAGWLRAAHGSRASGAQAAGSAGAHPAAHATANAAALAASTAPVNTAPAPWRPALRVR